MLYNVDSPDGLVEDLNATQVWELMNIYRECFGSWEEMRDTFRNTMGTFPKEEEIMCRVQMVDMLRQNDPFDPHDPQNSNDIITL